jgi:preprotein translocase subunit SecB
MEVKEQLNLRFLGVDFINLSLTSFKPLEKGINYHYDFNFDPKVFYPDDNKLVFTIVMNVVVSCKGFFEIGLAALGQFELSAEIKDDARKEMYVSGNAPAIMFPYVRAFLTTLTSNVGGIMGPVVLPPQFFNGKLEIIKHPNPEPTENLDS